jgi:dipeptidyl aminopeptidase/acylaminoacyl peptidase
MNAIRRLLWPLLAVLFCLSLAVPAMVSGQEAFTPEHVTRLSAVVEVKLSPDGRRAAYLRSVPRKPFDDTDGPAWMELHVADAQGQSLPFVTGKVSIGSIAWTPDGTAISYLARRGDDKERSLYVIPLAGGESRQVLTSETGIRSYSWRPDGKQVAFTATDPVPADEKSLADKGFSQEVYEENVRPTKVWIADVSLAAPQPEGEPKKPRLLSLEGSASQLEWSPQGNLLAVVLAPTPSVDDSYMNKTIQIVDPTDGKTQGVYDPPGKMGSFVWSPSGKHLAVISSADRNDPAEGRLVVTSSQGGAGQDVLPGLEGHVTSMAWRDDNTILYTADIGAHSSLGEVGRDGDRKRVSIAPEKGWVFGSLDRARDASTIALLSHSATYPPEVFLASDPAAEPKRITTSNPWLAGVRFAKQEIVTYKARDGLELEGILVRPLEERAGERYPLIVAVHGGPEAHVSNGWVTSYANPGQVAASRGMAVFYPNYRGSTGRGVAFSKLDHGDPAGKEFDDLVDGVDHLVASGLVDRNKVGITGGSYGGYASAWGATYYTERFAASVMFVGISDAISKVGTSDIPDEMYYVHHRYRVWEKWDLFRERSPIYHVEKARTPILILHGKDDTRVHPSQSLSLYRMLKMLGKAPVRHVRYPGEGHGNRRAASRYDYNLRMIRWMEHYLKGPGGDPPPTGIEYPLQPKKAEERTAAEK